MPCARKGQILLCKKQSDSTKKFSEADIINMLEFLIDNIFAMFDGRVFQQELLQEERNLDSIYSNRSVEFFRIHI
jgi:hypothetical protein